MADFILKVAQIDLKLITRRFLGSLITNLLKKIQIGWSNSADFILKIAQIHLKFITRGLLHL